MLTDKLPWRIQSQIGYRPKGTIKDFYEYSKHRRSNCDIDQILAGGYFYLNPPHYACDRMPDNFKSVIAQYYSPIDIYKIKKASIYMKGHQIGVITKENKLIADNTFNYDADYSIKHPFMHEFKIPEPIHYSGSCIVLAVTGGDTFYWHWMIDSVPKYGILELIRKSYKDYDHVLINEMLLTCHQQVVDILKIPAEKIKILKNDSRIAFDEMVIPSKLRFHPWVVHYLKCMFLPYNDNHKPDLRIYVSRQKARWRRIENEDEVWNLLKNKYNFRKVFFEDLTVDEQINLAKHVKTTVSLVGSNQINMIFYPKGAHIIEIQPEGLANVSNWIIAEQCMHHYHYFEGECVKVRSDYGSEGQDISINTDRLDKYLSTILDM